MFLILLSVMRRIFASGFRAGFVLTCRVGLLPYGKSFLGSGTTLGTIFTVPLPGSVAATSESLGIYGGFFRDENIRIIEARSTLYAVHNAESRFPPGRL